LEAAPQREASDFQGVVKLHRLLREQLLRNVGPRGRHPIAHSWKFGQSESDRWMFRESGDIGRGSSFTNNCWECGVYWKGIQFDLSTVLAELRVMTKSEKYLFDGLVK